jgi:hypothetical protein
MPEGMLAFGDENPLAAKIRKAMGVGPYEAIRVSTPQFNREDGKQITIFPKDARFLDALKKAPKAILKDCGLRPWGEYDLWLFPAEWYEHIPDGYEITDICGRKEKFKRGETDDDRRFGCLPYGICVKTK